LRAGERFAADAGFSDNRTLATRPEGRKDSKPFPIGAPFYDGLYIIRIFGNRALQCGFLTSTALGIEGAAERSRSIPIAGISIAMETGGYHLRNHGIRLGSIKAEAPDITLPTPTRVKITAVPTAEIPTDFVQNRPPVTAATESARHMICSDRTYLSFVEQCPFVDSDHRFTPLRGSKAHKIRSSIGKPPVPRNRPAESA
jgi:hypothetical protein